MAKLNLPQHHRVMENDPQKTLMDNLLDHNIPVASSCGGDGICGKCKVRITTTELPLPSDLERKTLEKNKAEAGERLSCQIHITQNAFIETSYW